MFKNKKDRFAFPWDRKPTKSNKTKAAIGVGLASAAAVAIAGVVAKNQDQSS